MSSNVPMDRDRHREDVELGYSTALAERLRDGLAAEVAHVTARGDLYEGVARRTRRRRIARGGMAVAGAGAVAVALTVVAAQLPRQGLDIDVAPAPPVGEATVVTIVDGGTEVTIPAYELLFDGLLRLRERDETGAITSDTVVTGNLRGPFGPWVRPGSTPDRIEAVIATASDPSLNDIQFSTIVVRDRGTRIEVHPWVGTGLPAPTSVADPFDSGVSGAWAPDGSAFAHATSTLGAPTELRIVEVDDQGRATFLGSAATDGTVGGLQWVDDDLTDDRFELWSNEFDQSVPRRMVWARQADGAVEMLEETTLPIDVWGASALVPTRNGIVQLLSLPVDNGVMGRYDLQLLDRDTGELLDEAELGVSSDGWYTHSGQRLTTASDGSPVVLIDHDFLGPVVVAPGEDGTLNVVVLPFLGPPGDRNADWVD